MRERVTTVVAGVRERLSRSLLQPLSPPHLILDLDGPDHILRLEVHESYPPVRLPRAPLRYPRAPLVRREHVDHGLEAVDGRAGVKVKGRVDGGLTHLHLLWPRTKRHGSGCETELATEGAGGLIPLRVLGGEKGRLKCREGG